MRPPNSPVSGLQEESHERSSHPQGPPAAAAARDTMTGKLLFLGGRPWRVGLDWAAPGPALSVSGIRREAALRGADIVVLRGIRGSRQTGYATAGDGRAPSLAAALCRSLSGEKGALLCLRLKDTGGNLFWWVLGILGGAVAPGYGDQVRATREEAGQAAVKLARLAGGGEAFTLRAASSDPEESVDILARLLSRGGVPGCAARFAWRCRPVRSLRSPLRILLELGLFCAACGFFLPPAISSLQEQVDALTGKGVESSRSLVRQTREHPEKIFPPEWSSLPEMAAAGRTCLAGIYQAPRGLSGWLFRKGTCRARSGTGGEPGVTLIFTYARTAASIYTGLPKDADFRESRPSEMTRRMSFHVAPGPGPDAWKTFFTGKNASARFLDLLQRAKARGGVRFREHAKLTAGDGTVLVCPWAPGAWNITGIQEGSLRDVLLELRNLPGFFLTELTVQGGSWTARGETYAR